MSLLLIILGAGLVFLLANRFGASLSRTGSAFLFLPPTIVSSVKTVRIALLLAARRAPGAEVFAACGGSAGTVGLP